MVDIGLGRVLGVPRQQVVQLRVDVLGRAVLVDDAVRPGGIVGHRFEGAGMQGGVEPLPELIYGPVCRLVSGDDLVELADGRPADGVSSADFAVDGVEGCHVVLQDGEQVVLVLTGARRWNVIGFEAMFNESSRLGFVQAVDAFDDAGLDGPAAMQGGQASALDLRPVVEPLTVQSVFPREVVIGSWRQRRDGAPLSRRHCVMLLDLTKVDDVQNGQGIEWPNGWCELNRLFCWGPRYANIPVCPLTRCLRCRNPGTGIPPDGRRSSRNSCRPRGRAPRRRGR